MNYCWKCGEKNPSGGVCRACGTSPFARLPLPEGSGKDALTMRRVYDRHGRNRTLAESDLLCDALAEALGDESQPLCQQVRAALDAGLGELYQAELANPSADFTKLALDRLTVAGLTESAAKRLIALFDDMIGLPRHTGEAKRRATAGKPRVGGGFRRALPVALLVLVAVFLAVALIVRYAGTGDLPSLSRLATWASDAADAPGPTALPEGCNVFGPDTDWRTASMALGGSNKREYIESIVFRAPSPVSLPTPGTSP